MRFVRLGALFGSLVLLVATSVSMFNRRAELRTEQDLGVVAASVGAEEAIDSTVLRARSVIEVAGSDTTAEELVASFGDGAAACVDNATTTCTGPDLFSLDAFGEAAAVSAADGGRAVAVVDGPSASVLVVSRASDSFAIQLPGQVLVDTMAVGASGDAPTVQLVLSQRSADSERSRPGTIDGLRTVIAVVADPLDDGSIVVTTSVDDEVGLTGDAPVLFGTLFALGTILLALAGWTFFIERRNLEERATTDELTGLVNRREFERQCEDALMMAGRFGTGFCVMLIDLNGFKQINDTMGHQFGDTVLKACAERLKNAVRETDVVGRWGGDEFVILLPGLEEGSAVRNSVERIAAGLSRTPVAEDVYVTASVGAALYPRHGNDLDELMRAADVAMYGAKTTGVTMRLADPIADADDHPLTDSSGYVGPDRRRRTDSSETHAH